MTTKPKSLGHPMFPGISDYMSRKELNMGFAEKQTEYLERSAREYESIGKGIADFVMNPPQCSISNKKPKKVIINGNTMVVIWNDNTKTRATCAKDDLFDPIIGFGICLAKRLYGKKRLARFIKKAQIQKEEK